MKIINNAKTTLSLDHARLPRLLKLLESVHEGLFSVLNQPVPMIRFKASIVIVDRIHLTTMI